MVNDYKITVSKHIHGISYEGEDKIKKILELSQEIYNKSINLIELQKIVEKLELELTDAKRNVQLEQSDINKLIEMRDQLEGRTKNWTYIYPTQPPVEIGPPYEPMLTNCPVCGIDFTRPMWYVCNNMNCPTPRATCTTSV